MTSLLKYFIKRLIQMIPVLFGVLTLVFILTKFFTYNPAKAYLTTQGFTDEQLAAEMRRLGLDQPLILQYFRFLGNLFTGDWGVSLQISHGSPVWPLVMQKFPRTIELTLLSMIVASFVGIKAGTISAKHRNKIQDTTVRGFALLGVSIPVFWLGMLLQYALSYQLKQIDSPFFFPTQGFSTSWYDELEPITGFRLIDSLITGKIYYFMDYIHHLFLPVMALSFITIASITRQTRSSMLEVLQQDYIRTARAKGCKEKDVLHTHALKNALIPTVTVIGLNIGALLGGAVLTETTFNLDGMGQLLITALNRYDYYVLNACVFLIAIVFVVSNFILDLLYAYLDPRIKY
ncbi:MAG: ABC transporter permease [Promethearchaeota archaeon]